MKTNLSTRRKNVFIVIGIYQVIGGVLGIILNIISFFTQFPVFGFQILFPVLFFILFGYSVFCGIKCLKFGQEALTFSIYNQVLQILGISVFGIIFRYTAGIYCYFSFGINSLFRVGIEGGISTFSFFYNQNPEISIIEINIIPIILIICVDQLLRNNKNRAEDGLSA